VTAESGHASTVASLHLPGGFVEACRAIIGIDSSPSAGCCAVAEFAAELAGRLGLDAEIQRESLNGIDQANVIIRMESSKTEQSSAEPPGDFLLETHLDTPDPGAYALWAKTDFNPFGASIYPTENGDVLFGLGSADVKLDFLCKLYALAEAAKCARPWRLLPVLVGTYGEELGMAGAIKLIRKKKVRPVAILVGEPTEMRPVIAGKGFASVEIEIPFSEEEKKFREKHLLSESALTQSRLFSGKSAHSSAPQHGESAIEKMLDALERLPAGIALIEIEGGVNFNTVPSQAVLEIDSASGISGEHLKQLMAMKIVRIRAAIRSVQNRFRLFPDAEFVPQEPTLNVGIIRTFNDSVKLSGCVRLPPTVSQDEYESWMRILRDACHTEGAVFRIGDYKAPFRLGKESTLLQIAEGVLDELGINAPRSTQAVANEANVFAKFGIETLVWGPGQGVGNSHTPNECVRLSELNLAIDFYRRVIERMCL
jgi:acetylornithine deacetylase/succinyl-diaminopimelate desuccinylase-like protein